MPRDGYRTDQWLALTQPGSVGTLSITTSPTVEAKVGATPLESRKTLMVFNNAGNTIYWGFHSTVTTATGLPIPQNEKTVWTLTDSVAIWLVGSGNVRVAEGL